MMRKLAADSASNVKTMEGVPYAYAPLKISTSEREFVDDDNFSIRDMLDHLRAYKGKSGTACPSVSEWLDAFGDADEVFG
ncbi:MAG: DegV family protein, partial [Oscillospiraceae bacterium]|nr:DegV family protein [Oscillospiraceae bacterium]